MICAYCGKEAKGTKEHIISSGILGLFPECFVTIDGERSVVHQGDPMVKDVCADCNNNRISYIDSYAKEFIEKYFLVKYKKDDTLSIEYEYVMIQKMCLKFAFNDLRARKKDVSFFDDGVKDFLLNEERNTPMRNITLLAGLAVNTSPAPDFMFGNMKLRWGDSPLLLSNSIVANIDYNNGRDSLVHREFADFLTVEDECQIREKFNNSPTLPDDDINTSVDQTKKLIIAIKNGLEYPSSKNGFKYDDIIGFFNQLSQIFDWSIYEKSTLGNESKRKWYAVILSQWMEGSGLSYIMQRAID